LIRALFLGPGEVTVYNGLTALGRLRDKQSLDLAVDPGILRLRLEFSTAPCDSDHVRLPCFHGTCAYEVRLGCRGCDRKPMNASWANWPVIEKQMKTMTPTEAVSFLNSALEKIAPDPGPARNLPVSGVVVYTGLNKRFQVDGDKAYVEWGVRITAATSPGIWLGGPGTVTVPVTTEYTTERRELSLESEEMTFAIGGWGWMNTFRLFIGDGDQTFKFRVQDEDGLYRLMASLLRLTSSGH
jgi:hypothetical protein